jgi:hypothetical protein
MKRLLVAFGVLSFVSSNSFAAISVSSDTNTGGWKAVGSNYDFQADQQTGQPGADIVGGSGYDAGFFTNWDSGSANSSTDGVLGFRVRFDERDHQSGFKGNLWVGIDADVDGDIDAFIGATSSSIGIFDTDPAYANNSPNTTRIAGTATTSYTVSASNYNYRAVATADGGTTTDITSGGTDTDYYLSFTVNFQDMVNFLNSAAGGNISITDATAIRYVVGTATQGNALNQDLGGVNGGVSSPTTWEQLGGFSPTMNATGTVIPEPQAALLGGLGFLGLLRRRRN